jgi:hypothetical protein
MHVLDLEAKLAGDASGALREELCRALADERIGIRRLIDGGLAPDDYQTAQAYHDACAAAERVVVGCWRQAQTAHRLAGSPIT